MSLLKTLKLMVNIGALVEKIVSPATVDGVAV